MSDRLAGMALPGRAGRFDVVLAGGRVERIEEAAGEPSGLLALPAFREPHTHADRAFAAADDDCMAGADEDGAAGAGAPVAGRPRSLADAIAIADHLRARATAEQVEARARRLLSRALAHGALSMRTHVDHHPATHARDRRAVRAAAQGSGVDVEIVAFATKELDPAEQAARRTLADALDDGADVLGAFVTLNPDPRASLDGLLDLAADTGAPVDVHLDEHLDRDASVLGHLAEATVARGLEGRVTAGHCCALAALEDTVAARVVERVAAAGITVVALPALNLYLQGRRDGTPRMRGVTLVHELIAAGVAVRFGSDNVRDPFFPYGDADPLEAAWLASVGAHVLDEAALLAGICGGRASVEPGDVADLVLLPAGSFTDALARHPGGRTVLRAGSAAV